MVYVDHQSVGTTPVSTSFVYYGTRQFEIIKDGYRTEKFMRRFNPPWYQWPVLDFVSESLWPFEKRDERIIDVELSPDVSVPTENLIRSGEELRSQASRGFAVSPPPSAGGPTAAELVIPVGQVPIVGIPNSSQPIVIPPFPMQAPVAVPPPTFNPSPSASSAPSIFDLPPSSVPASNVTPGPSYRPEVTLP
jgi:hypothetical protein